MFHNISNPKWFGNWSRLEDDYLGNGGTDIADNFTFSKREKPAGFSVPSSVWLPHFPPVTRRPDMPPALGRWPASPSTSSRCRFPISRT